jgi:K+ transporter
MEYCWLRWSSLFSVSALRTRSAAYGIAVTGTMMVDTLLAFTFLARREVALVAAGPPLRVVLGRRSLVFRGQFAEDCGGRLVL